jgi:hypothetical protein
LFEKDKQKQQQGKIKNHNNLTFEQAHDDTSLLCPTSTWLSQSQGHIQFCPNPDFSSKDHKVFFSEANLNKYFGAKPACYKRARSVLNIVLKESAWVEQKMLSLDTDGTTNYSAAHDEFGEPVLHRSKEEEL